MKLLILMGILVIIALLWLVSLRALKIYRSMKSIEKNLILEVSNTREAFQDLMGDLFEEEKPRRDVSNRRVVNDEEEDEI